MDPEIQEVLRSTRVIAVLGAHVDPDKPAFFVPDYMAGRGYRVLPVNPRFAGRVQWGEPFRSSLAELGTRVDLVDVFRRSAVVGEHLADILALRPRPAAVWLQLGVRHAGLAASLAREGVRVIQDRCLMADHQQWSTTGGGGGGPIDS
jgi:predicted CoA-binding protein